jgi:tetraacyldisaccharide 4'-kinase
MNLPPLLRLLLWPVSLLYGQLARLRVWLYAKGIFKQRHLAKPVISVGNLTVGGTGKTPMVIWLAERLIAEGKRVGILSRGYKGSHGTSDEIELMKSRLQSRSAGFQPASVVFGVGANRFANGRQLETSVDVFLLDDGFQHLALARDVDILLLDASQPLARQKLLPTGRLREPVSSMTRADILVFTRAETVAGTSAAVEKFTDFPVFSAVTHPLGFRSLGQNNTIPFEQIGPGPFYAFCGVGNPRAFFQDLQNWKLPLADRCEFRDHHRYDARDVRELEAAATQAGAKAFLTTEKDAQNLGDVLFPGLPVYIVLIEFEINKPDTLLALLREKIVSAVKAA